MTINITANVLRLCVCLPLAQSFKFTTNVNGQIAQNRCYKQPFLIELLTNK